MKTVIAKIATAIALGLCFISCTDDTHTYIQKIEATQVELKQQDSVLVSFRSELSSLVFINAPGEKVNPNDSLFNNLIQKTNPLITRLELMIEKNKVLVEKVKTNTGDSKQVEIEYQSQIDELELIKSEVMSVRNGYENLVSKEEEINKSVADTTKLK